MTVRPTDTTATAAALNESSGEQARPIIRSASLFLLAIAIASTASLCEAGSLYGFTDERGVAHFSNQPIDKRYKRLSSHGASEPLGPARRGAAAGQAQPSQALRDHVVRIADEYGVDPALGLAVIRVESSFNPSAISPKGAVGLMQLMPATATRYGVADPFDVESNLRGGLRYLRDLMDAFGDVALALAAYNAGEGAVIRHGYRIPPFAETRAYVPKVLAHYERLRAETGR